MDRATQLAKQAAGHLDEGDLAAAEQLARELLAAGPRDINALRIMGAVTRKQGLPERSLEYFREAVRLNDRKAILHFELGTAYTELHRSQEAYECYYRAIQLDPNLQVALVNLSAVMEQQQRFDEAIDWAEQAIALKSDCGLSYYNLANAQRELGRLTEAIGNYRQALRYKPGHAKTQWNLAICHLLAGNFREGWPLFEFRREAGEVFFDRFEQPLWDGSSLANKSIVIHGEQGIGDEVLFATCFPDVIQQAGHCSIVCDPRLEKLFTRSFPTVSIYPWLRRKDWSPAPVAEPIDVQIPAGSLPMHLRLTTGSFPRGEPLLKVDSRLRAMWQSRFAALGPGLKVGISWRAGGKPIESLKRTIPLERWKYIFAAGGAQFINLQYGDGSAEIATAEHTMGVKIHDWEEADPLVDVDSFAAKIAALDLVISVGNATVHLAGAVGTEVWTLLPMIPSWRWMAVGEESIWYSTVRLFRQPAHGHWQPVLDRMARMLREKTGSPSPSNTSNAGRDAVTHDTAGRDSASRDGAGWKAAHDVNSERPAELIGRLLAEAKSHEASGDFARAEACYREVLQWSPRQIAALNGLGVIARKTGRSELAIRSFRRSLAMIDALPEHQLNLADALADVGRHEEALACYRQALSLSDMQPAAHLQAARMAARLNRPTEVESHLRRALQMAPDYVDALVELGLHLLATCRIDEALRHVELAVQIAPQNAAAHSVLGLAALEDQQAAEAVRHFRKAHELDAELPGIEANLARALQSCGESADAAALYERSIERNPSDIAARMQLAMIRRAAGDLNQAAELLRQCVLLRPADTKILNLTGIVLDELGESADALDCFDDAVRFAPNHAEAYMNRALALLRAGRLSEGWSDYRWRWQAAGQSSELLNGPAWDGGDLAGKTILIHGEQALVDELMFASCYGEVIERAASCLIVCDPRLEPIFRRSFPTAHVAAVVRGRERQWRPPAGLKIDARIAAGDLPRLLRPSLADFPQRGKFLLTDRAVTDQWRQRFATFGPGLKIGLDWRCESGGPSAQIIEGWRQLLGAIASLGEHGFPFELIDLSGLPRPAAIAVRQAQLALTIHGLPSGQAPQDMDDAASQAAGLDLLISSGGIMAHLAGGLDIPSLVLVDEPAHWRWITCPVDREQNHSGSQVAWYPGSRLYRSSREAQWTEPVERLRKDLLNFLQSRAEESRMRGVRGPHWELGPQRDYRATGKPAC